MNEEEETIQDNQDPQDEMSATETSETQQQGPPRTFRDQPIYQLAFEFQQKIFEVTKAFPEEELYSLTEPLRLASRKIGASVAEAWVKRRFQSQYPGKLAEVEAHAAVSDHWIGTAEQAGYLTAEAVAELRAYVENIRGNVWRMTPRMHHIHQGGERRGAFRNDRRNDEERQPRDLERQPRDFENRPRPQRNYREGGGRYYNNRNNRQGGYMQREPRDLREPGEFRDAEPQY